MNLVLYQLHPPGSSAKMLMKLAPESRLLFYASRRALLDAAHTCLGLLAAFQCVFSLHKPYFRPVLFFFFSLIFLFPKTKQNALVKIKTYVRKGCAPYILWLCHSPAALLSAPKRAGKEENLAVFCAHHPSSLTLVSW